MDLLNRLLEWIKTHKKRFAAYVILGFIFPIVFVQVAYSIPTFIPSFSSPLSAGDLLGYYAAFIATAGTVFLGAVALWQNSVIHQKNVAIQEKNDKDKIAAAKPYLKGLDGTLSEGTLVDGTLADGMRVLEINIKNESDNRANIIKIYGMAIENESKYIICAKNEEHPLLPQEIFTATFIRTNSLNYPIDEFNIFRFSIEYSDIWGNIYSKTFLYSCNVPKLKYLDSFDDYADSNE